MRRRNEEEKRDEDGVYIENFPIRFKGKLIFLSIIIFNGVYREEHEGVNRISLLFFNQTS